MKEMKKSGWPEHHKLMLPSKDTRPKDTSPCAPLLKVSPRLSWSPCSADEHGSTSWSPPASPDNNGRLSKTLTIKGRGPELRKAGKGTPGWTGVQKGECANHLAHSADDGCRENTGDRLFPARHTQAAAFFFLSFFFKQGKCTC